MSDVRSPEITGVATETESSDSFEDWACSIRQ